MDELPERQRRILDFAARYVEEHGFPPSVREIGEAVGISSTSVVDYNLRLLAKRGLLRRIPAVSRGLELPPVGPAKKRLVSIPVVGRIAAGEPIEAILAPSETVQLPPDLAQEGYYALKVKGRSMIEDLIDDGDIVIVRPQQTAENGDIIVALLLNSPGTEGVVTLKRFHREGGSIRLQPANPAVEPMYVDPSQLRIQGKAVVILRHLD